MGDQRLGPLGELLRRYVADVVPRREDCLRARDYHAVRGEPRDRLGDRVEDLLVERVALGGIADREPGNAIGRLIQQELAGGEGTGGVLVRPAPGLRSSRGHSRTTRVSPSETDWPSSQLISRTTPSSSASTGISIFIDSRITSVSPSSTSWPSLHSIFHTVPVMCASTSGNGPPGPDRGRGTIPGSSGRGAECDAVEPAVGGTGRARTQDGAARAPDHVRPEDVQEVAARLRELELLPAGGAVAGGQLEGGARPGALDVPPQVDHAFAVLEEDRRLRCARAVRAAVLEQRLAGRAHSAVRLRGREIGGDTCPAGARGAVRGGRVIRVRHRGEARLVDHRATEAVPLDAAARDGALVDVLAPDGPVLDVPARDHHQGAGAAAQRNEQREEGDDHRGRGSGTKSGGAHRTSGRLEGSAGVILMPAPAAVKLACPP